MWTWGRRNCRAGSTRLPDVARGIITPSVQSSLACASGSVSLGLAPEWRVPHRFSGGGRECVMRFVSPRAKALGHPHPRYIFHFPFSIFHFAALVVLISLISSGRLWAKPVDACPPAPQIAPADQRFVTWVVRRTLEQHVRDGATYKLKHQPAHLAGLHCQVAVTLRQGGLLRGVGVSAPGKILEAAQEAGIKAYKAAAESEPVDSEVLARMCIEIEALGQVVSAPVAPYWGSAQSYAFLECGVHGIILQMRGATGAMRPSEFIANSLSAGEALRHLNERMNPAHESHQGMVASWFRATHWHEVTPRGKVVELRRGLIVLPPEAVTGRNLDEAAHRLADYMIYRQKPSGEFSYQYEPTTDSYSESNNYVRQADAAWGLALYAKQTGDPAATRAADRAVRALTQRVIDLGDVEGAGYFHGPDGCTDLGATALLCLALTDHPQAQEFRAVRDKLVAGMLWLQVPAGGFIAVFPPTLERGDEVRGPGQALLALAHVYRDQPREQIERAFELALPFYRKVFRKEPKADFVPWHTQAFALMAHKTGRREYAEFVFEMNDWLAGSQLSSTNCCWPELYGAIDPPGRKGAGASTAIYIEGFADALGLARELGDGVRAACYERVVHAAARFVMQLQFRREEGFYVRSPIDCYNGIRKSPCNNRIRIDNCRHALIALHRTRELLFP